VNPTNSSTNSHGKPGEPQPGGGGAGVRASSTQVTLRRLINLLEEYVNVLKNVDGELEELNIGHDVYPVEPRPGMKVKAFRNRRRLVSLVRKLGSILHSISEELQRIPKTRKLDIEVEDRLSSLVTYVDGVAEALECIEEELTLRGNLATIPECLAGGGEIEPETEEIMCSDIDDTLPDCTDPLEYGMDIYEDEDVDFEDEEL
jgi:hypothetical protein